MNVPRLRFKNEDGREFSEWEERELKDIAHINPKSDLLPDEFVYIDLESVEKGILLKETTISKDMAPSRAQRLLRKEDVLFQMVRPYQKNNLFFDKIGSYVASTGYAQIRAYEDKRFLYHCLHLENFIAEVMNRCTGTSYPAINSSDLASITIQMPVKEEQTKIANFLTAIDEKITQLTQKHDLLTQYKKGVMQQIFRQKLRFKDEDGREFSKWKTGNIDELVDFLSGYPFDSEDISEDNNGILLMRGVNITEGLTRHDPDIDRFYCGETKKLEKYFLKVNDLVIGMDGSKVGKNSALVKGRDINTLLVQRVARLRAKATSSISFIFQHVNSSNFHTYVDKVKTSSGIPHISAKQIKEFKITLPCLAEQTKIANFLTAIDDKITHTKTQLDAVKQYKKGLLQQMFV